MQMPGATFVAGFRRWLELGRHVRKGEKGIGILAPRVYRKRQDDSAGQDEHTPTREMGGNVRLACNDTLALCERMLTESGGTFDSAERIDLSNLVTGTAGMLSTCVPAAAVLRFDLAADLPSLDFPPVAMRQIGLNPPKKQERHRGRIGGNRAMPSCPCAFGRV